MRLGSILLLVLQDSDMQCWTRCVELGAAYVQDIQKYIAKNRKR